MKTKSDIQDRLRTIFAEELDHRAGLAHKRLPKLCAYYYPHPLDTRPNVLGEPNTRQNCVYKDAPTIGLCLYGASNPEDWQGTICDDPIDAQRCLNFTPTHTIAQVWLEFTTQVSDPIWLKCNLPEAYGLLWVLTETFNEALVPWWKRLWWRLLCVRPHRKFEVDPQVQVDTNLLPELPKNND